MQRRARPGLGTLIELAIDLPPALDAGVVFDEAFKCVEALEAQLSAHQLDSDLSMLCLHAHQSAQHPPAALYQVLQAAVELHRDSEGIFDVTRAQPNRPDSVAVSSADIDLQAEGRVQFQRPLRIDLGGIAKGYVIDRVVELLQARGVRSGCVNAGGDLRVFGDAAEPVALRFADGFRTIAHVTSGAFAASSPGPRPMSADQGTSTDTHFDGRDRRHIVSAASVAVFAPRAMIADALTKIALVSAEVMERLCPRYSAEWRLYPFAIDTQSINTVTDR